MMSQLIFLFLSFLLICGWTKFIFWGSGQVFEHEIQASSSEKLATKSRPNTAMLSPIAKKIQRNVFSSLILRQNSHCFSETVLASKSGFAGKVSDKLTTNCPIISDKMRNYFQPGLMKWLFQLNRHLRFSCIVIAKNGFFHKKT